MTVPPEAASGLALLERAFETPEPGSWELGTRELGEVEGSLPEHLAGTVYWNGPAAFRHGDLAYRHWLDGDGLVWALRFPGHGELPRLTCRWVESAKRREEEEAGRPLYRTFGTAFEGDQLVRGIGLASPVNVSIYPWNGLLLAFGEQGLPWELDPETLETRGEHTFGRLNPLAPFSAHPHTDASGELINFGISYARDRPTLNLYRFVPERGDEEDGEAATPGACEMVYRRRIPLEHPYSLHDFALSESHAAFFLAPYLLDMAKLTEEGVTVQDALTWRPELPTRLLVVDRETGEERCRLDVLTDEGASAYSLHLVNAFDTDDGKLVVDLLEIEEPVYRQYQVIPDLFLSVPPVRPVRLVVEVESGSLLERRELPFERAADFPALDPRRAARPYRHFWCLAMGDTGRPGRKFFDQLVRFDWQGGEDGRGEAVTWQAPEGRILGGEPVVVPDPESPEETGGAVLCQELDLAERRSAVLVFDAGNLGAGPVARIPLPGPFPPSFHGSFQPARPRSSSGNAR